MSNNLVGEVVTLVTFAGDMIGRLESIEGDIVKLQHPRLYLNTQDGPILAGSVCATAVDKLDYAEFHRASFLTVAKANDNISRVWEDLVENPERPKLEKPVLSSVPVSTQANNEDEVVL